MNGQDRVEAGSLGFIGPYGRLNTSGGPHVQSVTGHNPLGCLTLSQWAELGLNLQKSTDSWAGANGLSVFLFLLALSVPEPSLPYVCVSLSH